MLYQRHFKVKLAFFFLNSESVSSVQSLSCVRLFATPWTAARQASLSITNSRSPPKFMSIESVIPSNHLILLSVGNVMGGPARDEVMNKIPDRQSRPRPHPWWGHEENTWQARPSRIRDPPGWPQPLPYPISSPLFFCCSCLPCCGFLCCLPRALLLFHWMRTNLKP